MPTVTAPIPSLVVSADDIARRAGLPRPLNEETEWQIEQAIADAQADVEAYLGQPISPTQNTESGLWPVNSGSLTAASTWLLSYSPVIGVVSATSDGVDPWLYGTYTVVYTYGLDAATDPVLAPIRRWITAAVLSSSAVAEAYNQEFPSESRIITSVSAEGQSISYGASAVPGSSSGGAAGSGAPGAVPLLSSLDRWRVAGRRVFQRRSAMLDVARFYG